MRQDYLSRSSNFDDQRHWKFERQTHLPIGYFDKPQVPWSGIIVSVLLLVLCLWLVAGDTSVAWLK